MLRARVLRRPLPAGARHPEEIRTTVRSFDYVSSGFARCAPRAGYNSSTWHRCSSANDGDSSNNSPGAQRKYRQSASTNRVFVVIPRRSDARLDRTEMEIPVAWLTSRSGITLPSACERASSNRVMWNRRIAHLLIHGSNEQAGLRYSPRGDCLLTGRKVHCSLLPTRVRGEPSRVVACCRR